jgi:hypothetical protein
MNTSEGMEEEFIILMIIEITHLFMNSLAAKDRKYFADI